MATASPRGPDGLLGLDDIAEVYFQLHSTPRHAAPGHRSSICARTRSRPDRKAELETGRETRPGESAIGTIWLAGIVLVTALVSPALAEPVSGAGAPSSSAPPADTPAALVNGEAARKLAGDDPKTRHGPSPRASGDVQDGGARGYLEDVGPGAGVQT
jgi:hypothetical protein